MSCKSIKLRSINLKSSKIIKKKEEEFQHPDSLSIRSQIQNKEENPNYSNHIFIRKQLKDSKP